MDLGVWEQFVVECIVEAIVFIASAVGLALPRLPWISADCRDAYNTVRVVSDCGADSKSSLSRSYSRPLFGFDDDEKANAIAKKQ